MVSDWIFLFSCAAIKRFRRSCKGDRRQALLLLPLSKLHLLLKRTSTFWWATHGQQTGLGSNQCTWGVSLLLSMAFTTLGAAAAAVLALL